MAAVLPKSGRSARFALRALAFLWLVAASICGIAHFKLNLHGFADCMFVYLLCAGVGCLTVASLLSRGRPAARIAAWIVLPFCLVFFPVGPLLAIYAALNLESAEMKEFFRRAGCVPSAGQPESPWFLSPRHSPRVGARPGLHGRPAISHFAFRISHLGGCPAASAAGSNGADLRNDCIARAGGL